MTVAAGPRKRLGRVARRAAILDAAASAFAAGGYAATSMADIASAAGVSHLIVYRHFESKECLYEAVLERAVDALD
ncbi:MAG: helix-turn-helix domain-containing protein, partial [Acidimicrobiia bacterium]